MKIPKKIMNREIELYPIYALTKEGKLFPVTWIKSTNDYDHYLYELHHYIPYSVYERNKEWFKERNIEQKLILVSKILHERIELRGVCQLTDEAFKQKYKISRNKLIFNRRIRQNG